MPNDPRKARELFMQERIPSSAFLDLDTICDADSPLPHMLPGADLLARALDALGITPDSRVVVYDRSGIFSAPRARCPGPPTPPSLLGSKTILFYFTWYHIYSRP